MLELTDKPIFAAPLIERVSKNNYEDIVTFIGTVRNNADGKKVLYLEYEAYAEMARKKTQEICAEIYDRWKIADIAIVHRTGRIEIGENVIIIAVGAPDRLKAFQACQYAIDRIKETVPIFKKE
jgi:molybdopterin synthase catalytic subunit